MTMDTEDQIAPAEAQESGILPATPVGSLHPLVGPFERIKTSEWKARSDIRMALDGIKQFADEAALCLAPTDDGHRNLEQASRALFDLENMVRALWPNAQGDSQSPAKNL